ncbi:hypothetical protein [Serratia odorifera]|uniref:hypothetical protein n=1 Tax=Serratia odorifera TaxID=618 RepID=UPI000FD9BD49|nr:hypothetical protein [Serratia odorifera]
MHRATRHRPGRYADGGDGEGSQCRTEGTWAEAGTAGTYSATYTAKTAGTGLKASLNWAAPRQPPAPTPSRRGR